MDDIGMDEIRWTPTAERILRVASELFYARGIRAVGVDTIAEAAGTTKKTLYDRFGSKDRLVAAYLEARDARWRAFLEAHLEQHGPDPEARLLAVFDATEIWQERNARRGCSVINAGAELVDPDHPARRLLAPQKLWLRDLLLDLAGAAGLREPEHLADQLLLVHEGALVALSVAELDSTMDAARAAVRTLIATHRR
ncbi:MAG TPA: helix-turn-helix domain-containing protein [Nocardioidaceae bacterium]|nr:helix-turn-helix domain-containing protein [Nocardioidaceae bacterium]